MKAYLGVDVGSVSTNLVLIDAQDGTVTHRLYLRTRGRPITAVQSGLAELGRLVPDAEVVGAGATGSGRRLAGILIGADVVKNEITAHAVAALDFCPDAQTVIEIGGQDSKLILLRKAVISDFNMNTVCAAGTGSFLDQQAARLGISIEDFASEALKATRQVRIAGRCAVFAESDMIHKQQIGHALPDILYGLCQALVRNYLNNVARGKELRPPVIFQGGVAANLAMRRAFEESLGHPVLVPPDHGVMGAVGAAMLAREGMPAGASTRFRGFSVADEAFTTTGFNCHGCPNDCEIVEARSNQKVLARWGGRCERWQAVAG
ncbi:MAG: acyl-CoA dehydratase activase [Bacillota bacterium]